jgi:hypothetical protein
MSRHLTVFPFWNKRKSPVARIGQSSGIGRVGMVFPRRNHNHNRSAWLVSRSGARSEAGRSRPGKPLLSGESDPVEESCGAGRPGSWPPRQRLTAPRQTWPALRGGRKGLRPSSRGGRPRCVVAECQPGFDGSPGGAQDQLRLPVVGEGAGIGASMHQHSRYSRSRGLARKFDPQKQPRKNSK